MKIYIAGKVTGDPDYRDKFARAEKAVITGGNEPINPARLNLPESCSWDDYMGLTLRMLDMADAIALLPDWRESPGACMEHGYALAKDMLVVRVTEKDLEKYWGI